MFEKICGVENDRDEKEGYHDFPSKFLCLTIVKHYAGEAFSATLLLGFRKLFCLRGLRFDFLSSFFLSESIEKRRKGTLLCFTKILVSKKIMDEEEGGRREGVPRNSVEKPLSQSAENFCRGSLLCCVSNVFRQRKFFG